jgi:GTP cyclohydrolase I
MIDMDAAEKAVTDLLGAFGVDEGDHTARTPIRSAKAWRDVLRGYEEDPSDHLDTTFSAPGDPGLVIVAGISLKSTCAHHLLPFSGKATVAYRPSPSQEIVGLSKLSRVIHGYARRLQVQERIGSQTVDAIMSKLHPAGACVLITATHDCMRIRGVEEPEAETTTLAKSGMITDEELSIIRDAHNAKAR